MPEDEYRQAALELHSEIRSALSWIEMGAEPSVAYSAMRRTADKWLPLLDGKAFAPRTAEGGEQDG